MPEADARLDPLIDLLLTVGYIDGVFHEQERLFVKQYLDQLVTHVAAPGDHDVWKNRFDTVFERLDAELAAIAAEVVPWDDQSYVATRLKVRAVTLFRGFAPADQAQALELLRALLQADGTVSSVERALHDELVQYFQTPATAAPTAAAPSVILEVSPPQPNELKGSGDPLLDVIEQRYASDPEALRAQFAADYELVFRAIGAWERQRARGNGRLAGVTDIDQIPIGSRFLDGHVHVMRPDHPVELIVLGDTHGCYAGFKAALLQSDFLRRARAHQQDPANHPDVKLVLLGDYIDRGLFGLEGVLRAALQVLVAFPEHVIMLRGNHELFVRHEGRIVSAVQPSESLASVADRIPYEVAEAYLHLFDHMPTSFLLDRTLFVHAGIPRDDTIERYRDLSSLEDWEFRFQMMWSDPAETDLVPVELQRETVRFNFGTEQFRRFMERIGCHTMIRGHEQVDAGFATTFDLGDRRLHTLFSAGGNDNPDLPPESRYRRVTPMALTIEHGGEGITGVPWPLEYPGFAGPANNGLYR